LREKLDEVQTALNAFFDERAGLELISHSWNGTDYVKNLVSEID
jgi:hypothetical protein